MSYPGLQQAAVDQLFDILLGLIDASLAAIGGEFKGLTSIDLHDSRNVNDEVRFVVHLYIDMI